MIYFPTPEALSLFGPYDANVPNLERLIFVPRIRLNLAQYAIVLGVGSPDRTAILISNYFYWFPEIEVESGSWVFVYTGPGNTRYTTVTDSKIPAVVLHWGFNYTLFASDIIVPVLIKIGEIEVGIVRQQLPLLPQPQQLQEWK